MLEVLKKLVIRIASILKLLDTDVANLKLLINDINSRLDKITTKRVSVTLDSGITDNVDYTDLNNKLQNDRVHEVVIDTSTLEEYRFEFKSIYLYDIYNLEDSRISIKWQVYDWESKSLVYEKVVNCPDSVVLGVPRDRKYFIKAIKQGDFTDYQYIFQDENYNWIKTQLDSLETYFLLNANTGEIPNLNFNFQIGKFTYMTFMYLYVDDVEVISAEEFSINVRSITSYSTTTTTTTTSVMFSSSETLEISFKVKDDISGYIRCEAYNAENDTLLDTFTSSPGYISNAPTMIGFKLYTV